jgi:hypothetical protein
MGRFDERGERRRRPMAAVSGCLFLLATPAVASAGMPTVMLTDLARLRVQTISFFLMLILASAGAVKWIWNSVRRDFSRLPRLSYGRALAMICLWGFLFVLVLTMISGARELLTPGAWERDGAVYKLAGQRKMVSESERRAYLMTLKKALWDYAAAHGGAFPPDAVGEAIPAFAWETPDVSRIHYLYVAGAKADGSDQPVAYEPAVFPSPRLVLCADGEVRTMSSTQIQAALPSTMGILPR